MTAIENCFVNKPSLGIKKSETDNQMINTEKISNYRNINDIYQKNLNGFVNIDDKNFDIF